MSEETTFEMKINTKAIEGQVVEKIVAHFSFLIKDEVLEQVRAVIAGEIRDQIKKETALAVETLTLTDGRTFKQYVIDKLEGRRVHGETGRHSTRLTAEIMVERTVKEYAEKWYRELLEPHMAGIKDRILEEFARNVLKTE